MLRRRFGGGAGGASETRPNSLDLKAAGAGSRQFECASCAGGPRGESSLREQNLSARVHVGLPIPRRALRTFESAGSNRALDAEWPCGEGGWAVSESVLCRTREEARRSFGVCWKTALGSGSRILLETALRARNCPHRTDGRILLAMAPTRDHKRVFDATSPNTGGMARTRLTE